MRVPGRMPVTFALLGVLAAGLAGCHGRPGASPPPAPAPTAPAMSFPAGSSSHAITVGGISRQFIVYRPARLPAAAPLVVMMHGGFGTDQQAEDNYNWDGEAAAGRFVVAYPNGVDRAWNTGGGCCGVPAADGINDVAFITAMVADIERGIPIDRRRVYATGISNGGIMAYTLACQTSIFAAIGPDSATQLGSCPHPSRLSVIHIHGTADTRIPYHGGMGDGAGHIDGPAIPALNATWRAIDHCRPPRVTVQGVLTTSVAGCPGGRAVELITIAGAGHQWPGSVPHPIEDRLLGLDPPSTALNATQVIWQFFAAHPRR